MSAEEEADALKIYWERFFKAETGTYEKSTWLELFLAEFIIRLNDGQNAKKSINFCPLSGVVSLVGCELLCGIHRVTSSINTHYSLPYLEPAADPTPTAPTDVDHTDNKVEDTNTKLVSAFSRMNTQSSAEILRNYLLGGVAWRCLVLLRALGVEGLSCCRQLSSVLIWLFGETCVSAPRAARPAAPPARPRAARPRIHELFSNRIWSKQKPISVSSSGHSAASSEKSSLSGRPKINGQSNAEGKFKRRSAINSDQSSESGDSNDDLEVLNKSMNIKICSPNDDFEYFNSKALRSSNEYHNQTLYSDPFFSPRKAKPKADDYMTEKHREIINTEISTFEFTILIIDLLQELCKAESSLSGSEGSQISMQCINFSLKNLCSLQFGSLPTNFAMYEPLEMSRVKVALTELLIVSLDQVLIHSDLCAKLINNGILPMLLRVLEDVICKSSIKYNTKAEREHQSQITDKPNDEEPTNLLKFIFGIAYSITAFFHCLLMQCRTVEKLREFTDQFKLYGECLRGGLLKECIELMIRIPGVEEEESSTLIKKLIDSIGKLISAMKRVRSEVIHSAACPRDRHRLCRARVAAGMHHHHDILGPAGAGPPLPAACCVAVLYATLAALAPEPGVAARRALRDRVLRAMLRCGVCCCFSPSYLMEGIVRLMLTHGGVSALCLRLLEHTVYGDLGASILVPRVTDQLPCSICEQSDDNRDLGRKYCPHGVSPIERRSVWSFLIHYNSLLQLDNHNEVLHATVTHLLKVTPKCRTEMKYELLFSVIYPTFIVAKHRYTMRLEESAYFLTVSCLNIFANLLNTVSFAEQFIQKGGLSYVLELVSMPEFSNQCCAILEIAIIVEIFKLIKENVELTYFREMGSLASVVMLFKSLTEATDNCVHIYGELPEDDGDREGKSEREEKSTRVGTREPDGEGEGEGDPARVSALRSACTFWRACARLCGASGCFRAFAATQAAVARGAALLRLLLRALCAGAPARETRLLTGTMEALLTVQFAVSEATGGRSKETSCAVVREALSARAAAGGGGLRALCDALVGVALAAPSAPPSLRVPPLFCSPGSSSPDCSSSEESGGAPYASEHSEPRACADDGYEADVEISKMDLATNMKSQKLTDSLSILNNVPSIQAKDVISMECPEYGKGGELVHPELCVIVVDILSQLIDKLLSEKSRDRQQCEEISRVCAGLARACGAGGRAGAAGAAGAVGAPRLLRRLLAAPAPCAALLAIDDPAYTELQRSVLELVRACAGGLEAGELAALLRLFAAPRPPLALLLPALRDLAARARPHTPDHVLAFPVDADPEDFTTEEPVGSSFSQQAEFAARRLRQAHLRAGVRSPWSAGAARCALGDAGWAPWLQGFALAIWLRLQHRGGVRSPWSAGAARCALGDAGWAPWLQGFALAIWLRLQHRGGVRSPWSAGAARCALGDAGWAPWLQGFALAIWLRLQHRGGVRSPWSAGAARCALGDAGWAPWLQGFALAIWLRLQHRGGVRSPWSAGAARCALGDAGWAPWLQGFALAIWLRLQHRGGVRSPWSAGAARCALGDAGWAPWLQGFALAIWLRLQHRGGVRSPWSAGAARCALGDAGWAPWLQGFALAIWLRLQHRGDETDEWQDEPPDPDESPQSRKDPAGSSDLIHVFSIGHDSLMFELWIDTSNGTVCARLTRPDAQSNRVVSSARARTALAPAPGHAPARWRCLALNVAERVHKRRIHIQVTIYVDGCECETLSLPIQGILVRKATPSTLVVGQAGPARGALHVGGVRVFRAPALSAPAALHLAAHGPDLSCQIPCESAYIPSIITPELIELNIDWDSVYEISSQTLREMHDNLLLTFYPHAPDVINLYHQAPPTPTVFGGRAAAGGAGGEAPEALRVRWAGAPRVCAQRGFAPALLALGGPDLLLYLFARVVELESSAEQQAGALAVLLRASGADARLSAALHAGGLDLLLPVLAARSCRVSHHMLKVILDEACSSPILLPSGSAGSAVTLLVNNDSILLEPRLLLLLMRAWRHFDTDEEVVWEESSGEEADEEADGEAGGRQRGSAWLLALAALRSLLRPAHAHRAFNHMQACRVDLLRQLLHACKERFLNSERAALGSAASARLVALIRALLALPPPLPHLALLADFLLLMHQASDTFVTHSRANFYFLLTADAPETSDFNFLNFMNKQKSIASDNKRLYDNAERSTSSSVSNEDFSNENHVSDLKDTPQSLETGSEKTDLESTTSTDSTKQMKGLINMQIKEGSQKLSSTSEISDSAIERSTEEVEEVAVKADDVTKVQEERDAADALYTGSIYRQRRVRTGAEPGWRACAGLLLLLRDALRSRAGGAARVAPDALVVLANHGDAFVRAAAVRAAAAAPLPPRALPLLANQIALYPCSWELVTACAVLLTGCDVPLEDQLDEREWSGAEEAAARAAPLLALLPRAAREDAPLARHAAALLTRLVDTSTLKSLIEVALIEVVVRSIRAVGQEENDFEGRDLLLEDLYDLLCRVAIKVHTGNHPTQTIVDMHNMLRYVECAEEARAGVRRAARGAQVALLRAQLQHLQRRLRELRAQQPRAAGYFSSVLSSVESGLGARAARSDAAEAAARLAAVLARAAAYFTTRPPDAPLQPDADFFDTLLSTLLNAVNGTGNGANSAESGAALSTLFWWAASPTPAARPLQPRLLRALYGAPVHALRTLAGNYRDPPTLRKLSVYLLTLVQNVHLEAEAGAPSVELAITDWARDWAVGSQAELAERVRGEALPAEAERLLRADRQRWARHAATPRLRAAIAKSVLGKEALARAVTEAAMSATRRVVEAQNAERKAFLEQLRRAHALAAAASARWQTLIDAHTHERGVWHDPRCYPAAWQLDSTEGPGRVRVRLRRAHLRIPTRCFQPPYKYKAESAAQPGPLHGVLAGGADARGALAAQLALSETVAYMARVVRVSVDCETGGELLLTDRCIHFVPEEGASGSASWSLGAVLRVATRRWCLQERALELFLCCGRALLLAFADTAERAAFLQHLARAHLPNRTEQENLTEAMNQWRIGAITNWEYLMILNGLAGRSYNDLMQYPVYPFIIADYTSKILDLTDPASFRDLSKPMAVQNKNREQRYINTYNDLKAARNSPLLSRQPHHYASLYSNSGGVLHYLVRLPPFTELFLNYQDNNFDMPDRTFHSMATTWRLITNDSPTDVKELIPELFYLPELFYNNEGLELGVRQCGERVDAVELAPWAADARLFTLLHRQALEAPCVSERLPLWIDLVFGYKQTGQAAVDAINVFPACTYYGFDPSSLEDERDRTAAATMVRTYGQAPRQLLRAPHPHRATDLAPRPTDLANVWGGVVGARWGRYCGSPERAAPAAVLRRVVAGAARLQALAAARAVAVCPRATALLVMRDEWSCSAGDGSATGAGSGGEVLCAVTWGHSDGIVRLRRRRDVPPTPLLHLPASDQVTAASGWSGSGGWGASGALGLSSGRVLALRAGARVTAHALHAHCAPIVDVLLCPRASLLVTACRDGVIVLWDLNELTYIRTLPNRDMLPVRCVAVSETLSDVATVHEPAPPSPPAHRPPSPTPREADEYEYERDAAGKCASLLRVHTVNGRFVGSARVPEEVTCACYSNAPEGVSVNCVALGLGTGGVRLYSSWDLRPVAYLPPPPGRPLAALSVTYSADSQLLFACYAEGVVLAWESAEGGARAAPVRVLPALALL